MIVSSQLSNEAEVTDSVPEAEKESVATWHSRKAVLLCLLKALYYTVLCFYSGDLRTDSFTICKKQTFLLIFPFCKHI